MPRLNNISIYDYVNNIIYLLSVLANISLQVFIYLIGVLISMMGLISDFLIKFFFFIKLIVLLTHTSSLNKPALFALTFFYFFKSSNSRAVTTVSLRAKEIIVTCLGFPLHWLVGYKFEKIMFEKVRRNKFIWNNKFTSFILGLTFAVYIFIGVFFTNGVWYFISDSMPRMLLFIFSSLATAIFGTFWHGLGEEGKFTQSHVIRCIFRSMCETLAFTSVATSTYCFWFWLPSQTLSNNILYAIIGLVLDLPFSGFAIMLEYEGYNTILYGVFYFMSFLCGSVSTNGFLTYIYLLGQ